MSLLRRFGGGVQEDDTADIGANGDGLALQAEAGSSLLPADAHDHRALRGQLEAFRACVQGSGLDRRRVESERFLRDAGGRGRLMALPSSTGCTGSPSSLGSGPAAQPAAHLRHQALDNLGERVLLRPVGGPHQVDRPQIVEHQVFAECVFVGGRPRGGRASDDARTRGSPPVVQDVRHEVGVHLLEAEVRPA